MICIDVLIRTGLPGQNSVSITDSEPADVCHYTWDSFLRTIKQFKKCLTWADVYIQASVIENRTPVTASKRAKFAKPAKVGKARKSDPLPSAGHHLVTNGPASDKMKNVFRICTAVSGQVAALQLGLQDEDQTPTVLVDENRELGRQNAIQKQQLQQRDEELQQLKQEVENYKASSLTNRNAAVKLTKEKDELKASLETHDNKTGRLIELIAALLEKVPVDKKTRVLEDIYALDNAK